MADAMLYRLGADGARTDDPPFAVKGATVTWSHPDFVDGSDVAVRVAPLRGGGTISLTLRAERVPDLLALMFCQLDDHEHDGFTCVPSWIRLGED